MISLDIFDLAVLVLVALVAILGFGIPGLIAYLNPRNPERWL